MSVWNCFCENILLEDTPVSIFNCTREEQQAPGTQCLDWSSGVFNMSRTPSTSGSKFTQGLEFWPCRFTLPGQTSANLERAYTSSSSFWKWPNGQVCWAYQRQAHVCSSGNGSLLRMLPLFLSLLTPLRNDHEQRAIVYLHFLMHHWLWQNSLIIDQFVHVHNDPFYSFLSTKCRA
jgi:hypothetical protein